MYQTYIYEELDSTNIKAKQLASEGAASGTSIIAKRQTKGRGRLGKEWFSREGLGLYCSFIVRPDLRVEDYAKITLTAGLAVGQVIEGHIAKRVSLKWPNDVLVDGRKISGILTESSPLGPDGFSYAVVGVGVNVNHRLEDFPEGLKDKSTSLLLENDKEFEPVELVDELRENILASIDRLVGGDFKVILQQWKERDYLYGKNMVCVGAGGKIISGRALGPDEQGVLHVLGEDGVEREVLSGDLSLAIDKKKVS